MVRRARRLGLLLATGALLNIAVAWICAAAKLPVFAGDGYYHNPRGDFPLVVTSWRHFGREQVGGVGRSGTLLDREPHLVKPYAGDAWWPREAVTQTMLPAYAVAAGWPMPTVSAWRTTDSEVDAAKLNLRYIPVFHWGFGIPSGDWHIILPLRPMWRGVIVNTLVYAGVFWALVAGALGVRRGSRQAPRAVPDLPLFPGRHRNLPRDANRTISPQSLR